MGLLSALSGSRLARLSGARRKAIQGMIASERVPVPANPVRMPTRASDGSILPAAEPQPFKRSFQGGSEDLMSAARMIRPEDWPQFMALLSSGVSMAAALEMMTGGANAKNPAGGAGGVSGY